MNLIVGGTGTLGSALAWRLLAAGLPVRVMTRTPEKASALAAAGAEIVQGDLLDRESLSRACEGVDAAIAAAHSLFGRGRLASARVDGQGHRDLIDAAVAAGVSRFVYTSAYSYNGAFDDIPFFRIKRETEAYLKASGLAYTILQPTAFMEAHAHALLGEPVIKRGKVALFGRGEAPRNFVAADDVAQIAALVLRDPSFVGQTITIGGPGNYSNMDVVRLYERFAGRKARVMHVPLGLLRTVSTLTRPLHPGMSQVLQVGVLADTADQRFDAQSLQERFQITMTELEDWIPRTLGAHASQI
jgi:uncharacterized protein YbjT (DUF2867 family)